MPKKFRPGFLKRKPEELRDLALERLELAESQAAFELDWLIDWADRPQPLETPEQSRHEP